MATKYRARGTVYDSEYFSETWVTTVTADSPLLAQKAWTREARDKHPQAGRLVAGLVIEESRL